jgi:hypothetical protein
MNDLNVSYRYADEKVCALILSFIKELASYEKMSDQVIATEELL